MTDVEEVAYGLKPLYVVKAFDGTVKESWYDKPNESIVNFRIYTIEEQLKHNGIFLTYEEADTYAKTLKIEPIDDETQQWLDETAQMVIQKYWKG